MQIKETIDCYKNDEITERIIVFDDGGQEIRVTVKEGEDASKNQTRV